MEGLVCPVGSPYGMRFKPLPVVKMLVFAAVGITTACGAGPRSNPIIDGPPVAILGPPTRDLDLVFVVENSGSIGTQTSVAFAIPTFVNALRASTGGLPSLHVAVTSTSMGAGAFDTVTRCGNEAPGNDDGAFQYPAGCAELSGPSHYLVAPDDGQPKNFDGTLESTLGCMLRIGPLGCGFEQPFQALRRALVRASKDEDPENGGFLRPEANLAIVVVADEDDCSVELDSTLFNPSMEAADAISGLGPLSPYRCARFGYLCDGVPPPSGIGQAGVNLTLHNCTSADDRGPLKDTAHLIAVGETVDGLKSLKPGRPDKVLFATVAGDPEPVIVGSRVISGQADPWIESVCDEAPTIFAQPAVRLSQATSAFGSRGVFQSACETPPLNYGVSRIAENIRRLGVGCLDASPAQKPNGNPDCFALERGSGNTEQIPREVPVCEQRAGVLPCWKVYIGADDCPNGRFVLCRDSDCTTEEVPSESVYELHCRLPML